MLCFMSKFYLEIFGKKNFNNLFEKIFFLNNSLIHIQLFNSFNGILFVKMLSKYLDKRKFLICDNAQYTCCMNSVGYWFLLEKL